MNKVILIVFGLLVWSGVYGQSGTFVEEFDGNTKQTILMELNKVTNPNFEKGYLLVVDTIIPVYTADSSGQFYYKMDTTRRKYLGFKTENIFEHMTVFSDKEKKRYWVWTINDGKLEKSEAPSFLYGN